jgi:aspartate/glutamate racemase
MTVQLGATFVAGAACGVALCLASQGWRARRRRRVRADLALQPRLVGALGGLGPKATVAWYDSVVVARVRLFAAMAAAATRAGGRASPDELLEAVQAASTADWTAHEVAQVWSRRADREKLRDQDHCAVIIYSNPTVPGRPEFMSGHSAADPAQALEATAQALADAGASALCIVCSTAHYFKDRAIAPVLARTGVDFLDMIELTLERVARSVPRARGERLRVGLLGTEPMLRFRVYETACQRWLERRRAQGDELEIEMLTPLTVPGGEQANFNEAIFGDKGVKAGFDSDLTCPHTRRNFDLLAGEVLRLVDAGVKALILGCTELPLLIRDETLRRHARAGVADHLVLVNPADVLADEVVRYSLVCR